MNDLPELPDGIDEFDDLKFRWHRNARRTQRPDGGWELHDASFVCCLPGGTTPEELEALAAYVRAKQAGGAAAPADDAAPAPESRKPRKSRNTTNTQ